MATLATYRTRVQTDLLNDPNNRYWTQPQIDRFINRALKKRDRDTGQNRTLFTFVTTIGIDTYTFTNIGNTNVFDLIGINLLFQNLRIVLGQFSFSELNARLRQFNPPFQWAPVGYARFGSNQFVLAPAPAIAYSIELDSAQMVADDFLVNPTDVDPLPAPFDEPVPYWAARLAKFTERMYDEATEFEEQYNMELAKLVDNRVGMVPSLYGRFR